MMFHVKKWWAWQGLNLRPLRFQHSAYRLNTQKTAIFSNENVRTRGEHARILDWFYRTFAAGGILA